MSALDFGNNGNSNSYTRGYTISTGPAIPGSADWCFGMWVRQTNAPAAATYPTLFQTQDGVQGTTGGLLIQLDGDNSGALSCSIQLKGQASPQYPGTGGLTYDGRDVLIVVQRRSNNFDRYVCDEGGTAPDPASIAIAAGDQARGIDADEWWIGHDCRNPLGEWFFLTSDSLTTAQVTALAAGEQISTIKTPLIHLPIRDGYVATEANLGSAGSSYDAAKFGTDWVAGAIKTEFWSLNPVLSAATVTAITTTTATPRVTITI